MVDATYPLRVIKHKFAKAAYKNNGSFTFGTMALCATLMSGGIFLAVDKTEDNIKSAYAPQTMEHINNKIASLTEQKQSISAIKQKISKLEFAQSVNELNSMKKQKKHAVSTFKNNAENMLDYILTNNHLSEQQVSGIWDNVNENLFKPKTINKIKYKNTYDFGFLKESKQALGAYQSTASLVPNITKEIKEQSQIKNISVMGILGLFMFLPAFAFSESRTAKKWAENKPKKLKKNKY